MKHCPACQKTYPDEQNFCLDDGTTLVSTPPGSYDSSGAPTANYPYSSNAAPTEVIQGGSPTAGGSYPAYTAPPPQYPPQQFTPPYATQKRSPVLWIVLGVIILAGGIVAIILIASRSRTTTTTSTDPISKASPSYSPSPASSPSSPSSWQTVNGDEFTFSMPGSPSHDEQSLASAAGPIPLHLYTLSSGFEGYIVGYSIYPDSVFASASPEDLLNGAQKGAVNNVQGEVTSQRSITIDGNPGREIVGTSPSKNIGFTARVLIVKPRMYMIVYTQYDKAKPMSSDGRKFIDSFQLK